MKTSKFKYLFIGLGVLALPLASCEKEETQTYTFSITIEGEGGEISGTSSGEYGKGYLVSLEAIIYDEEVTTFDGYYEGDNLISEETSFSFTLNRDLSLIAKFSSIDGGDDSVTDGTDTFYHVFVSGDLGSSGSNTSAGTTDNINGLIFDYSAVKYKGYDSSKGIQLGSNNNPSTVDSPFTLTATNIPNGVSLVSFEAQVCANSSKTGYFELSVNDNYSYSSSFYGNSLNTLSDNNINEEIESLEITMYASDSAVYLYSLEFVFYIPDDVTNFSVSKDGGELEEREPVTPGTGDIPDTVYTVTDLNTYYADFDLDLTGDDLRDEINEKNEVRTTYTYGQDRYALQYIDESIDNPGYVYLIYDGEEVKAEWDGNLTNREHVWCCSHMGIDTPNNSDTSHGTDLHNLRLSYASTNSSRGNKFFDDTTSTYYFYPNVGDGDHRGDVARILFYMYCTYPEYCTDILEDPTSGNNVMGILSVLLEWNEADPVDEFETQRNNRIYEYQGNRNPFIDYPDLANQLFA